jgi:hypothetical protein
MDPFEEFEFKPLTKGLGFHKKPSDMDAPLKSNSASLQKLEAASNSDPKKEANRKDANKMDELNQIMSRIPSFDKPVKIDPILPREEKNYPGPTFRSPKFKNSEEAVFAKTETKFEAQLPKHTILNEVKVAEVKLGQRKEVPMSFGAAFFDGFVILGLLSLFTGVTLAVTEADFNAVWANAQVDLATRLSLALLAFSVIQFYLILSRSFFGATLGEWAFELTVGSAAQQKSAWYPLQITWRSMLAAMTGFITLPLIGKIVGKDLMGRLSGVRLGRDI